MSITERKNSGKGIVMINLNKESIKKIKEIDNKADNIILKAEKASDEIISKAKHELPPLIKEAQDKREKEKAEKIDETKKSLETETKKKIEEGISKIKKETSKVEKNIDIASDVALEIFIKKIEQN